MSPETLDGCCVFLHHNYVDGYKDRESTNGPLQPILPGFQKTDEITWGNFISAAFLKELRASAHHIHGLGAFISELEQLLSSKYPLALPGAWEIYAQDLLNAQEQHSVPRPLCIIQPPAPSEQLCSFTPQATLFLDNVECNTEGVAVKYYPAGKTSPVVLDPQRGFGRPTIRNTRVSAKALWEYYTAGDTLDYLSDTWDYISEADIRSAIAFVEQSRKYNPTLLGF